MDVEKKRAELLAILAELDAEIQALSGRITKAREDLANVYTVDDAKQFDESHDLEKGLKHIVPTTALTAGRRWTEVTAMRLIDADKLERQEYWGNERCFDYVDAEDIDNAPTVDAVEVVRCKDCKYYDRGECYHPRHERHLQSIRQEDDDFCSYGERKEGAE